MTFNEILCKQVSASCCGQQTVSKLGHYPDHEEFHKRISPEEWGQFVLDLETGLWNNTHPCACLLIIPGFHLTLPLCMLSYQLLLRANANQLNFLYDVIARYNKHLFNPRGILVRLQKVTVGLKKKRRHHLFLVEV